MHEDLEKVLFTREQIQQRIEDLAREISRDYRGRELMLVTVLKGAVFFLTHLAQSLEIPDRFVVGFGLDYDQRYRTLPCVGILKSQIYQNR